MADGTSRPDSIPRPVRPSSTRPSSVPLRPALKRADRPEPLPGAQGAVPLFREVAGEVLRDARRRLGLRLVDVARRAGVSPQYLSEIERGVKDPSSEMLAAVAEAVDLSLDALLAEAGRRLGRDDLPVRELAPAVGRVLVGVPSPPAHPAHPGTIDPVCRAA